MAEVSPSDEQQSPENAREISEKQSKAIEKVAYYKLFSFADATDWVLMVIGVITSVASGLALPAMTFLYGELANAFGHNVGNQAVVHEVSKVLQNPFGFKFITRKLDKTNLSCHSVFGPKGKLGPDA